ncbi:GntR family transcriptional regulator [Rugosimonospora africana]|uniref:GntR family transcriptional regulator n=1 Tax=Rugosimonospora africana TaxID=556532 RepID=A0A8J3VRP2_9ACTN|nr:GntR family transcriptional regulator [Rugosimonospora africana]GIH16435.1 GntR family transcriptional regulator [Rugosimonospora africana]
MAFSPAEATVDRSSPVPLYYQLAQQLEAAIESGDLARGTQLGNEIALADQLGLSRPTVRRAIGYLVDRGLLVRKRGVGTQVVQPRVRRPLELTSLFDDLTGGDQDPTTEVLSLHEQPAPDLVARSLALAEGAPVAVLERLRYARGEPLAVLRNYLPADLVPLSAEALERTGLYQLMRAAGIRLHLATQTVGARCATAAEARLLRDRKGGALLTMQRTAYDDTGRAVEFGNHYYRASLYSFEFVLSSQR